MPRVGPEVDVLMPLDGSDWPNVIAPAILLDIDEYHPDKAALEVQAPTLFVLAERDDLVYNPGTVKIAGEMADATVENIDASHFDFYVGESFEQAVALEIDFLTDVLLGEGSQP
jgi:fermentation-respiration switch protein FrsA (DUF1100 family)